MEELYSSSAKIYINWIQEVQQILLKRGKKYSTGDGGEIDILMKAIAVIAGVQSKPPSENVPLSAHFQVNDSWMPLVRKELFNFNSHGDEYICSTTEAFIKINGIKRTLDRFSKEMFFRGEHIFGWDLISRLGRKINIDWTKTESSKVTEEELKLVHYFQHKVKTNKALQKKIFGNSSILDDQDSGWWSIMQHYDDEFGTRMIDVTSSVFSALYFACTDWDGSIDKSVDGKLYFFPYQTGRGETDNPDLFRGEIIGTEDFVQHKLKDYFTVTAAKKFPRFKVSPVRNDRALSQDGYFTWQPEFNQPLQLFQHFPFRIHRDFKQSILGELKSMGYTKDRILNEKRFGVFR
jgi:FRG domain